MVNRIKRFFQINKYRAGKTFFIHVTLDWANNIQDCMISGKARTEAILRIIYKLCFSIKLTRRLYISFSKIQLKIDSSDIGL